MKGLIFDCEWCGKTIEVAAALMFSPPANDMVRKHHMCMSCYNRLLGFRNARDADIPN